MDSPGLTVPENPPQQSRTLASRTKNTRDVVESSAGQFLCSPTSTTEDYEQTAPLPTNELHDYDVIDISVDGPHYGPDRRPRYPSPPLVSLSRGDEEMAHQTHVRAQGKYTLSRIQHF